VCSRRVPTRLGSSTAKRRSAIRPSSDSLSVSLAREAFFQISWIPPRRLSVPSTEHVNGSSAMCSAIWGGVDEIECGTFKYLSAVTRMDSVRSRGLCVVPRTPPCARIATSAGARYRGHLHHIGVGRRYAGSCMTEDRCFQIDDRIVHVTHVLTTASTQGFA
jgi:hypothetical protein